MKKTNKLILTVLGLVIMLITSKCTFDQIEPEPEVIIDPGEVISFSEDIIPVFTDAGCINCHDTGKNAPDLSAAKAFTSLTASSKKYIDLDNPEQSLIVTIVTTSSIMGDYTSEQRAKLIKWITDGASNN